MLSPYIINKNKRNPRYQFVSYLDESGQAIEGEVPQTLEKKTEVSPEPQPEKSAEAVAAEVNEGITVIRKKPGPKPKIKNAEE